MNIETEIELYESIKKALVPKTYEEQTVYRTYAKIRHHIDQMLVHLGQLKHGLKIE